MNPTAVQTGTASPRLTDSPAPGSSATGGSVRSAAGVRFMLDELRRWDGARHEERMEKLTRNALRVSIGSFALSTLSVLLGLLR